MSDALSPDLFPRRTALLRRKSDVGGDPKAALQASIAQATDELARKQVRLEALVAQVDAMQAALADLQALATADMDPVMPAIDALLKAITAGSDTVGTLAAAVEQIMNQIDADTRELDGWDQPA